MGEKEKGLTGIRGRYARLACAALITLGLDQLTKALVMKDIASGETLVVIPDFFDLVNIKNRGAAFGFLNRSDIEWQFWLFLIATILAFWVIFKLAKETRARLLLFWSLGLILGGALGNLIDRLRFRAVVDFLDFYIGQWHWPAFNIADSAICIGAFLTCAAVWRKPEKAGKP